MGCISRVCGNRSELRGERDRGKPGSYQIGDVLPIDNLGVRRLGEIFVTQRLSNAQRPP